MKRSLPPETAKTVLDRLAEANRAFRRAYPGERGERQPVHTVYGGAHLFRADSAARMGEVALRTLREVAPDAAALAGALAIPEQVPAGALYARVVEKLEREPVEDFRIDFEDGFGNRPDPEEDREAERTALEVARGMEAGSLPPFVGIRIKPLTEILAPRAVRTLDLFVTALAGATRARLPGGFVATLPKVTIPEQVEALAGLLDSLESRLGLTVGSIPIELMVETPQSIVDREGRSPLPRLVEAARGRCRGAHFGIYDYTAASGITAAHQSLDHSICDFARHSMLAALAGRGVWLSDGATNVLPVGPDRAAVLAAWRLAYAHIRHSLRSGFYQGWDLHPAQLPIRYAAVFSFFFEGVDEASLRLKTFVERAAQATLVGDVFDDAATGQALLNFFLRATNCGALSEQETTARTGLTLPEIRSRSFVEILEGRRRAARGGVPLV
jgi:citrate lyase beta subunit